jgi:hypothetical protein
MTKEFINNEEEPGVVRKGEAVFGYAGSPWVDYGRETGYQRSILRATAGCQNAEMTTSGLSFVLSIA